MLWWFDSTAPHMTEARCSFPGKQKFTRQEAGQTAAALRRKDKGWVSPYRCPRTSHWHVGHGAQRRNKRRSW